MSIAILGCSGRMGNEIAVALRMSNYSISLEIDSKTPRPLDFSSTSLVIDFSSPEALESLLPQIVEAKVGLISGTTGLTEQQTKLLHRAANDIPILHARNFSRGVNVLEMLVANTTQLLGKSTAVEIVERHHKAKRDSPSGTAITLGEAVAKQREQTLDSQAIYGRRGGQLERKEEIAFHSLRGGNIVGDHDVHFIMENECVTLSHHAQNRSIFAEGAVAAIPFLQSKKNGFFTYQDMLTEELK